MEKIEAKLWSSSENLAIDVLLKMTDVEVNCVVVNCAEVKCIGVETQELPQ